MKTKIKPALIISLSVGLLLSTFFALTQNVYSKKQVAKPVSDTLANEERITSDDPWSQMDKIVAAYYSEGGMFYKGSINVYDDNGKQEKLIEQNPFEYTLFNTDYHYRLSSLEVISKPDFTFAVDHNTKTVALAQKVSTGAAKLFDLRSFKQAIEEKKASLKVSQLGTEKILTVDGIEDPTIQGYRIYYSPTTFRVNKIVMGMTRLAPLDESDEQQEVKGTSSEQEGEPNIEEYVYYVEIKYDQVQKLSLKGDDFNPESKIIDQTNHHIQLTPAFSEYHLLDTEE